MISRLASRSNFRTVEKEWQWEWVFYVLSSLGIPEDSLLECLPEDQDYSKITPLHKIALRKLLNSFDISVVDDVDGGIKIYFWNGEQEENMLIAEWRKCKFVFREDPKALFLDQKIFVEIQANPWVSFEENHE